MLGQKSRAAIERFPDRSRARTALQERFDHGTLWDAFLRYLSREGYAVPAAQLARDVTAKIEPSEALRATLIEVYRRDPMRVEMCERLVDLDEGISRQITKSPGRQVTRFVAAIHQPEVGVFNELDSSGSIDLG